MKKTVIAILGIVIISSCGGKISDNLSGFQELEREITDKFGEEAFYTDISVSYDKPTGLSFSVTATRDSSSYELEEWNWVTGTWTQTSEVALEITGGKPQDFMFNLVNDVSITKMAELVALSKKKVKDKKNIETVLNLISVSSSMDGDKSKMQYFLQLKPVTGGTSFNFYYDLKGTLKKFDY